MLVLLVCYVVLAFRGLDTKFIESAFLIALGAFVGLLKATTSPQTNVQHSDETTIQTKGTQ